MSTAVPQTGSGYTITINSVVIEDVLNITPVQPEVGTVEYKPLGTQWVQYLPTMTDAGEVTFQAVLDEAATSFGGLFTLLGTPSVVPCIVINTKSSKEFTFNAILTKLAPNTQDNETLSVYDGTLKVSGAPAIASSS